MMGAMTAFDPVRADVSTGSSPFPWLVADGAFDPDLLATVVAEWPPLDDPRWKGYREAHEYRKLEGSDPALWSPAATEVLGHLGAPATIRWVVEQLGLTDGDLVAQTVGGGYHTIERGGYLAPHVDFNGHLVDGRWRRVNVLLFLVEDYDPAWGGKLQLGDPSCEVRLIEPRFGRLVAFETSSTSWHGHPDPWLGPVPRRSIAVYYFADSQVPAHVEGHGTRWLSDEPARREHERVAAELDAVRLEQHRLAAELDEARAAENFARTAAAAHEARAEVLEHELADLRSSTSWRITAPLRAVGAWRSRGR